MGCKKTRINLGKILNLDMKKGFFREEGLGYLYVCVGRKEGRKKGRRERRKEGRKEGSEFHYNSTDDSNQFSITSRNGFCFRPFLFRFTNKKNVTRQGKRVSKNSPAPPSHHLHPKIPLSKEGKEKICRKMSFGLRINSYFEPH